MLQTFGLGSSMYSVCSKSGPYSAFGANGEGKGKGKGRSQGVGQGQGKGKG